MKYLIIAIFASFIMCCSCKSGKDIMINKVKLREFDNQLSDYHAEEYVDTLTHEHILIINQKGKTRIEKSY